MEIREMREMLGDSLTIFSKRYGIPYRTLQSWERGERVCPPYVSDLLERVVLEDAKATK